MFHFIKVKDKNGEQLTVAIPNSVKIQKGKKLKKKLFFLVMFVLAVIIFVTVGIVLFFVQPRSNSNSKTGKFCLTFN